MTSLFALFTRNEAHYRRYELFPDQYFTKCNQPFELMFRFVDHCTLAAHTSFRQGFFSHVNNSNQAPGVFFSTCACKFCETTAKKKKMFSLFWETKSFRFVFKKRLEYCTSCRDSPNLYVALLGMEWIFPEESGTKKCPRWERVERWNGWEFENVCFPQPVHFWFEGNFWQP